MVTTMNLDRGLIKAQAKELIKGKVMKLFLTTLVIQLCLSVIPIINTAATTSINDIKNIFRNPENYFDNIFDFDDAFDFDDDFNDYRFEDDDDDYYNQFEDNFNNFGTDNNSGKGDFYNFGTNFVPTNTKTEITPQKAAAIVNSSAATALSLLMVIAQILLIPLTVTLLYFFVLFIRGKEFSGIDGLKFIFKETFTNNYGKKIGVALLRALIALGLGFVSWFILYIPVFIFYYSSYFAYEIMCDNPQLSPWQAIKLSKKMIKGNRTELFVLDLSFIPWELLCVFLFPLIYVVPYVQTTRALYYENFRIRALQQGRVSEDDFLTDYQRMQKYAAQNNNAYQQGANGYQQNSYNPNPQQPNGSAQQANYQPNTNQYQYSGTYQQSENTQAGTCDASPIQTPPYYAEPQGFSQQSAPTTAEPQTAAPPVDEPQTGAPVEPQTADEPAENEKPEPLKPSEKYTPVTPPTESYTPTEDTNE